MIIELILGLFCLFLSLIYLIIKSNRRERMDFRGKHVLVTGGSSGIGFDLCVEAFKQGSHVSIIARNLDRLKEIKNELENIKKQNDIYDNQMINIESCDISNNYEDTKQAIDRLISKSGPVDVLINNAGIFKCIEFSESNPNDHVEMMKVNYIGALYCTKAVVNSMKKRNFGRIVFVSSQAGQIGIFGYTGYSASKFALKGFADSLQMELKPYKIYITLSFPPDTDTPGLEEENKNKPEPTRLMADSSGVLKSKVVAIAILNSIKKGSFSNYFGLNGLLLSILTSGVSPTVTFKEALIQIFLSPLTKCVAFFISFDFDRIVQGCYKKKLQQVSN